MAAVDGMLPLGCSDTWLPLTTTGAPALEVCLILVGAGLV